MLKDRKIFLFVLITILFQAIFMLNSELLQSAISFLDGVPITSSYHLDNQLLLYWYLSVVGMSFYFSGFFNTELMTYGKFVIIRNYSKSKWLIKRVINMMVHLLAFVIFQVVIFHLLGMEPNSLFSENNIKLIIIYYFTLLALFTCQLYIELIIKPQISHLIVNIYIIISIIFTKEFYKAGMVGHTYYFFLPNYGMGYKTGLSGMKELHTIIINYWMGITILILFEIILIFLSLKKIKKMDIF